MLCFWVFFFCFLVFSFVLCRWLLIQHPEKIQHRFVKFVKVWLPDLVELCSHFLQKRSHPESLRFQSTTLHNQKCNHSWWDAVWRKCEDILINWCKNEIILMNHAIISSVKQCKQKYVCPFLHFLDKQTCILLFLSLYWLSTHGSFYFTLFCVCLSFLNNFHARCKRNVVTEFHASRLECMIDCCLHLNI